MSQQDKSTKVRNRILREFVQTVEDNHMNIMFCKESKRMYEKAKGEKNQLMREAYSMDLDAYYSLICNNVMRLDMMMEQLGFNEIDFKQN